MSVLYKFNMVLQIKPLCMYVRMYACTLEADIFSGIPRVTGIPRDGKQNRYESRDWDGRGKYLIGSGRDRE